ncbi:MAG: hypothetical protein M1161_04435 [Candidatus Thermoplasmatota archaeon]|jgi:hypothetical protein|nr:hypothetical protein [Candidatus Thermoplasmatota archaeon]
MNRIQTIRSMKIHIFVFLALILVQFWLGMTINLEVALPILSYGGISALIYYATHFWPVLAHIIIAITILIISARFVLLSLRVQSGPLLVLGIIGVAAILGAIYNGVSFLLSRQFFGNSIGMAMSAVSSVVVYGLALYYIGAISTENAAPRI